MNRRDKNRSARPRLVLVGQPNSGKSTLFNHVAGYRSLCMNIPGSTVECTYSRIELKGETFVLVDLPGIYSLTTLDDAGEETKKYLLTEHVDAIINVVDASILGRSLELTLQLLDLELPTVLCLNMMDEAARKGVIIDTDKLSSALGLPVVSTIASKGQGVAELFNTAHRVMHAPGRPAALKLSRHVEQTVAKVASSLSEKAGPFSRRLVAIKLLEGDPFFSRWQNRVDQELASGRRELVQAHGQAPDSVISAERHALAMDLFERAATVQHPRKSLRDNVDNVLMHPVWGYMFMILILFGFFYLIFGFGAKLEEPLLALLNLGLNQLSDFAAPGTLPYLLMSGLFQGFAGGFAIVLPYLIPFLFGLSLLEDLGYLPRVAYLMDSFMHKIGLHGTAVIPLMLGYGCTVPAILATRILTSARDRFIAVALVVLIPCSARMTIIMGLLGYYLGAAAAFAIYFFNILVVALVGSLLSRLMREDVPGMIMEIPDYRVPHLATALAKTWFRLKDFFIVAWPLLIVGSVLLSTAQYFNFQATINSIFHPLTAVLGLPDSVGTTLIFGILRKELALLMLFQALGTSQVDLVLSTT